MHLEESQEPVKVSGDGCGGVSRRQEGPKPGGMLAQGLDFIVVKLADDDRVYRSKQRCQFRRQPAVSVCALLRPRGGYDRQTFDRSGESRVRNEGVRPCRARWWPYH